MSQRKSGGRRAKGFYDPSLVGKLSGFCLSLGVLAYKGVKRSAKKLSLHHLHLSRKMQSGLK